MGAAIDDHPILSGGEFETQSSGMGAVQNVAGALDADGRPRIEHGGEPARGQSLEAAMGCGRQRLSLGFGARQHKVDQPGLLLESAVEQRQPAIAEPEESKHRRHPVDRVLNFVRDVSLGGQQSAAQVHEIPQHEKLQRRAAFEMPAVGKHLPRQFAGQHANSPRQRAVESGKS